MTALITFIGISSWPQEILDGNILKTLITPLGVTGEIKRELATLSFRYILN